MKKACNGGGRGSGPKKPFFYYARPQTKSGSMALLK